MSRRLWLAAGGLLVAAVAVLVALGRGGEGATAQAPMRLEWEGAPRVLKVEELPTDRILVGRVRNASVREVALDVDRVRIVGANGAPVKHSARFLSAFAHGLYPPADKKKVTGTFERTRLGEIVKLEPGASAPLTLSWRVPEGAGQPVEVRFGGGALRLPD